MTDGFPDGPDRPEVRDWQRVVGKARVHVTDAHGAGPTCSGVAFRSVKRFLRAEGPALAASAIFLKCFCSGSYTSGGLLKRLEKMETGRFSGNLTRCASSIRLPLKFNGLSSVSG